MFIVLSPLEGEMEGALISAIAHKAVGKQVVALCLKSTLAGIDGCCVNGQECLLWHGVAFWRYQVGCLVLTACGCKNKKENKW